MTRIVAAETLDGLAADDPAALRSRRDLQRIHRVMGTRGILLGALANLGTARPNAAPLRVLELGAGDGSLLLGVAEAVHARSPPSRRVELCLLDRQPLLSQSTIDRYANAGWTATSCVSDVAHWIASPPSHWNLIVANLFLHHFASNELATMFATIAERCDRFFACEPRRDWAALAGSHLVGALGANAVTRGDAVLSVRAGFAGMELSALWPAPHKETPGRPKFPCSPSGGRTPQGGGLGGAQNGWRLREYSAAPFSHCFVAMRGAAP